MFARVGTLGMLAALVCATGCSSSRPPHSDTDVTLVISYSRGTAPENHHVTSAGIAAATGASACWVWFLNPASLGPSGSYEVHLRVPKADSTRAAAAARKYVTADSIREVDGAEFATVLARAQDGGPLGSACF